MKYWNLFSDDIQSCGLNTRIYMPMLEIFAEIVKDLSIEYLRERVLSYIHILPNFSKGF